MTVGLVQMGRRVRPIWALSVAAAIALILPIGGCLREATAPVQPAALPGPSALGSFQTDNGLLYPPELWSAVGASEQARFLVWRINRELDPGTPDWSGDPTGSFEAIAAESDETTAAFLLVSGGVTGPRFSAWCPARIAGWADSAAASQDIDGLWMASETAHTLGCPLQKLPARATRLITAAASGEDVIPAWEAASILARLTGSLPPTALPAGSNNLRGPLDAARFLYLRARFDQVHVSSAPELARTLAADAAPTDDLVLFYLVGAHLAAGDEDIAKRTAAGFDPRRRQGDGSVLEVPRFDGSVGSTYRMLRRYEGRMDAVLSAPERERIMTALTAQRGKDAVFAVTADAARTLLDPASVSAADAKAEVSAALLAMGVSTGPLASASESLAWASIAECAASLHVPVVFPGLTDAAVKEWLDAGVAQAAPTLARFLLAAHGAGATTHDARLGTLLQRLDRYLSTIPLATSASSSLIPAALASHRLSGRWALPQATLRDLLVDRAGGCAGGFDGFLREAPAAGSICNVDSSLAADQLAKELTP
ncbi:MAG: hypothetical protein ACOH1Y_11245 [Propionicimonas sp.]